MRKHIFGFALFSLIFAAFAVVYAFFYAPSIPPIEAVNLPVLQTETREEKPYSCQFRKNKISYEVQTAVLNLEKKRFTSQLTIYWNGNGNVPKEVVIEPQLFTLENVEKSVAGSKKLTSIKLVDPFKDGLKKSILIESDATLDDSIGKGENIYVVFGLFDEENGNYFLKANKILPEAHQVLIDYGKNSSTNRNKILKN